MLSCAFDNQVLTVDDVRNVYLNHEGRLLQLKDLCEIEVRNMTRQNINRHEGKNCVSLAVIKQSDAQMGELREAIADVVDDLQKNNPELKFDITRDQTELLAYSINNLEWNLVAAIFSPLWSWCFSCVDGGWHCWLLYPFPCPCSSPC